MQGAGGMGEAYRARDTRLNRIVAIKVLHFHLAQKAEAREHFEREARAIWALHHPQELPSALAAYAGSTTKSELVNVEYFP